MLVSLQLGALRRASGGLLHVGYRLLVSTCLTIVVIYLAWATWATVDFFRQDRMVARSRLALEGERWNNLTNVHNLADPTRVRLLLNAGFSADGDDCVSHLPILLDRLVRRPLGFCEAHESPLLKAAGSGLSESVAQLLAAGADVNRKHSVSGLTPLGHASAMGNSEVVRLLIEAGADVNVRMRNGSTPLEATLASFNIASVHDALYPEGPRASIDIKQIPLEKLRLVPKHPKYAEVVRMQARAREEIVCMLLSAGAKLDTTSLQKLVDQQQEKSRMDVRERLVKPQCVRSLQPIP